MLLCLGGGINIVSSSIPDGNNFTSGNMSSVFFDNVFINPCIPLVFTSNIDSEFGDVTMATFNFVTTNLSVLNLDAVRIYPNPVKDRFVVAFNSKVTNLSLSIYDILGKNIYYQNQFYNIISKEIILDNIQNGSYLIIMNVDGDLYHHQMILQD